MVEPTWSIDKVRREAANLIAAYKLSLWKVLKDQPQVLEDFQQSIIDYLFEDMKHKGITDPNPLMTVNYIAELAVNIGTATVSVVGDETEATISYVDFPGWQALKDKMNLDDEQVKEELRRAFKSAMALMSKKIGLECVAEAPLDNPIATITFRR